MPLSSGTRLGPYEIQSAIGAGGMGEVYRARDTALGRQVAIKVLPDAFAADPERLARFEREAKTLAALNHPHIAQIYGLERSAGTPALVMELVEGETLADRVARGPIPIDEALLIAKQIAEALEDAHEQGIIHRDLKPANVKVRADGTVKVLDFGLAKASEPTGATSPSGSISPTIVSPALMTGMGVLLGTAAYMSPEQARGKPADKRSDIWAFGCVLYEMLTGKCAFDALDVADTLALVLKGEPNWSALPATTPASIRRVLRRCLEKDRKRRLPDAADIRLEIDDAQSADFTEVAPGAASTSRQVWLIVALCGGALIAAPATWMLSRPTAQAVLQVTRLSAALSDDQQLTDLNNPALAVSPRGDQIAYTATSSGRSLLYLRTIDSIEPRAFPGTELATNPFFSPDGQWIGFFAQAKLKKVSVATGTTQTVCDAPMGRGGSWAPDNSIYFAALPGGGISKVSADGGTPTEVTAIDRTKGEVSHRWPQVLPGGRALLFTVWTGPGHGEQQVQIQRLDSGQREVVIQGGESGRYVNSGHVVYVRSDELFAIPFDLEELKVSGPPSRLNEVVLQGNEGSQYAASDNGTLIYMAGGLQRTERRLAWVRRDGRIEPLKAPPHEYNGNVAISPDGQRAVVDINSETIGLWLYDFARETLTPLTTGSGSSQAPRWSPDGTRVVYRGTRAGFRNLWWKVVDDASGEERLTSDDKTQTPGSWSADGRWLSYNQTSAAGGSDIGILPVENDRKPRIAVATIFNETNAMLSPDGRWLAYASDEPGRVEVFVQPFPGPGGRTQISNTGGSEPVWSRNGRELFYLNGDSMMAVPIQTTPTFAAGTPLKLFEGRFVAAPNAVASYDVSADGQRFLRVEPMHPDPPANRINVVLNWTEELQHQIPTK